MGSEWRLGGLIRERYWGLILSRFPVGARSNDWTLTLRAGTRFSVSAQLRV